MIHFDETMLQGMEETCRDFDIFCDFLLSGSAKLAKKTGNIGRKDCFALNQMLMVQESEPVCCHQLFLLCGVQISDPGNE